MPETDNRYPSALAPQQGQQPVSLVGEEAAQHHPDLASAGLVNVFIPIQPGQGLFGIERGRGTKQMFARDVPAYVEEQTARGFRLSDSDAVSAFSWHVGALEGLGIADDKTLTSLRQLGRGFASASNKEDYFNSSIRPFLKSLTSAMKGEK